MKRIGKMILFDNGKESFDFYAGKTSNRYEVEQSISGYYRLYCNDELIHDDSAFEDVNEEDPAYYYFSEIIKERENLED